MGYSIAIRVSSSTKREKAVAFLQKHYRSYVEIFGKQGKWDSHVKRGPIVGPLGYDQAKRSIGFDYSAFVEIEDHYIYSLMAWLAMKVGDKNQQGIPFLVYDGNERWPVIIGKRKNGDPSNQFHCDEYGWHSFWWEENQRASPLLATACFLAQYGFRPKTVKQKIRKEIELLNQKWNEEIQ
jgi:hypothetical protein